jgi:phage terminase small subunit
MPQTPKSDRMKIIQGTYRPDREKPDVSGEPIPPDCPKWLSDVAMRHWSANLEYLISLKVAIHQADQMALATYAVLCAKQETDTADFSAAIPS